MRRIDNVFKRIFSILLIHFEQNFYLTYGQKLIVEFLIISNIKKAQKSPRLESPLN